VKTSTAIWLAATPVGDFQTAMFILWYRSSSGQFQLQQNRTTISDGSINDIRESYDAIKLIYPNLAVFPSDAEIMQMILMDE
jgi:hypothetical protein